MALQEQTQRVLEWSRTKKDFEIDWFSGTGPGGQHKNKCMNSCRIKDKQTGLVGMCQEHRSRSQNQKVAFRRLVEKLKDHYEFEKKKARGVDGEVVRTYHEADNRIVDHQTGARYSFRETVGNGDMAPLIEDRMRRMLDKTQDSEDKGYFYNKL